MPPRNRLGLAAVGTLVAIIATIAAALGGYYGTCIKVAVVENDIASLRKEYCEYKAGEDQRWQRIADTLQLLDQRGVRNETKIDAILTMVRDHIAKDK